MDKLSTHSRDITGRNIERIAELFPTVVTEELDDNGNPVRVVDFDLLRQELSDHVVEGPQERYQLDWPGKRAALFSANAPIAKTLRPVRQESVDFDTTKNIFVEGDNLDALKLLQESYLSRVKLIYIDPPYNTGRDFVYNDEFAETRGEYLSRSGQVDDSANRLVANTESNGRFHSDWLSMLYPRLRLTRNLLADDGMVVISIDDNEVANLRRICDSVFGESNFVAQFVWTTKNAARGVPPRTMLMSNHEYLVVYARDIEKLRFKGLERDEGDFDNPDGDPRGLWRSESMKATGAQDNYFTIVDPTTLNDFHANWAFSRARVMEMIEDGLVLFPNDPKGTPRQKKFIDSYKNDRKAFVTGLGWYSTENATKALMEMFDGQKVFDFPKPVDLLAFLVDQATIANGGEIVLDLFAGSATMAHAVMTVNASDGGDRRFFLIQLPEPYEPNSAAAKSGFETIAALARERIRRAARAVAQEAGLLEGAIDLGFRALIADSTSYTDVLRSADALDKNQLDLYESSVKPERTSEDLLFEVLLDWGLELTMPIEVEQIDGHEVLVVEGTVLLACFSAEVSLILVRAIAARGPLRAVFRDSGFATDADRINAEQIFAEVSPSTEVKVI
jgi:adenine-specific DNA-methyltransferase